MPDLVSLEFDRKTLGLTPSNLSKTTIAHFFNVQEEGLHLKVVHNGKTTNMESHNFLMRSFIIHDVVSPLHDVVLSFCDVVSPLCDLLSS